MVAMITMPIINSYVLNPGLISKDINSGSIDTDSLFSCVDTSIICVNENEGNNNVITNNGTILPTEKPGTLTVKTLNVMSHQKME